MRVPPSGLNSQLLCMDRRYICDESPMVVLPLCLLRTAETSSGHAAPHAGAGGRGGLVSVPTGRTDRRVRAAGLRSQKGAAWVRLSVLKLGSICVNMNVSNCVRHVVTGCLTGSSAVACLAVRSRSRTGMLAEEHAVLVKSVACEMCLPAASCASERMYTRSLHGKAKTAWD